MARLTGIQIGVIALVLLVAGSFVRGPLPEILVPAEVLGTIAGFGLTNTMLAAWVTIAVLLLLFRAAISDMQLVPRGVQNFVEFVIESLDGFVTSVAGERWARKFFPLVATIFLFVLTNAWLSLLPGFGTIGFVHHSDHGVPFVSAGPVEVIPPGASAVKPGEHAGPGETVGVLVPILRGANTDLNLTLALALVAMFFIEMWGIQAHGALGYGSKFINLRKIFRGQVGFGIIDFVVGLLELVSELVRILSFSFRLFGNMFAGEVLLAVIVFLVPWSLVLVFYSLEIFVGFVQALVFAGLTLVFARMAVAGHGDAAHQEAAHQESH